LKILKVISKSNRMSFSVNVLLVKSVYSASIFLLPSSCFPPGLLLHFQEQARRKPEHIQVKRIGIPVAGHAIIAGDGFTGFKVRCLLNRTRMTRIIPDYSRIMFKKLYPPIPSLGAMVSVNGTIKN